MGSLSPALPSTPLAGWQFLESSRQEILRERLQRRRRHPCPLVRLSEPRTARRGLSWGCPRLSCTASSQPEPDGIWVLFCADPVPCRAAALPQGSRSGLQDPVPKPGQDGAEAELMWIFHPRSLPWDLWDVQQQQPLLKDGFLTASVTSWELSCLNTHLQPTAHPTQCFLGLIPLIQDVSGESGSEYF